jgi:hypothetical protein
MKRFVERCRFSICSLTNQSKQACELLNNGHQQAAVDIAMDILSHSDVGPYRRAVVNLFVSTNAEFFTVNQADYAIECLNILVKLQETMTATELERPENSSAVGFINFARDIEAPIKLLEQQATARLHEIYAMCLEEEKKGKHHSAQKYRQRLTVEKCRDECRGEDRDRHT